MDKGYGTEVQMEEIRRIRNERGLSQARLSELSGVDPASLSLIETGRRSPGVEVLQKLADGLGVEVADFFPRAQPDLFTAQAKLPPVDFALMIRATPQERRRALGAASDAEVGEYVRAIDRALERSADWGKDEQDQVALAAYRGFLGDLRDEASPFVVVPPTPQQRAAVAVHSRAATSTAG